jgi:uncharacterized protein YbgA (DUF1722 family)
MNIPTGHRTITYADTQRLGRRGRQPLWKSLREGDTYVDRFGRHWECHGTFVKPAPTVNECSDGSWREDRGIPAGVEIRYETSYTKSVVDGLLALGEYRNTFPAIRAAIDLLKDYHASLHAPYEQRDKARQDLYAAEAQLAQVQKKLLMLRVRFSNRMRLLTNMATRWKKDVSPE